MESFWQSATIEDNYTLTFAFYLDQTYSSAPFYSDIPDCSFASPSQLYGFLDLVPATKYFLCFLNQGAVKCLSFSLIPETPPFFLPSQMHFLLPVDITSPKCTAIPVFRETHRCLYLSSLSANWRTTVSCLSSSGTGQKCYKDPHCGTCWYNN